MESNRIYFFTQSHNAEKTIARTIESVLNQSYSNLVYYIADNASTDETKCIIEKYANLDSRVQKIFCSDNKYWNIYSVLPQILQEYSDGFFAQLDADDEYHPLFAESVCSFMREKSIDIASCLSQFLDAEASDISKEHIEHEILIEGIDYQQKFPAYFKFFRDSWGKIFSLKVLRDIDYKKFDPHVMTGSVSYIAFEAILRSARIGVYPKQLHKYYVLPTSFERNPKGYNRILTPELFQYYEEFIIKKCGFISEGNRQFLCNTFCKAIYTKMSNIQIYQLSTSTIMQLIRHIFMCEFMQNALISADVERICAIRDVFLTWIVTLEERDISAENFKLLYNILKRLDSAIG